MTPGFTYTKGMKKKDDSKAQKILDAAAQIILTQGVTNLSTIKIAKNVGIAQSNVYAYFENKQTLLTNLYERELNRIDQFDDFASVLTSEHALNTRIEAYVHAVCHYAVTNPDSLTLIEAIKSIDTIEPSVAERQTKITSLLNEGIEQGYLKPVPINLMLATVFHIAHQHGLNIQNHQYTRDTYPLEKIENMILDAIKVV